MSIKRKHAVRANRSSEQGLSLLQLMISVAVIAVVSAMAVFGIVSARQRIRLTNSARVLSSYIEKARVDSVRRHASTVGTMAGVAMLNNRSYRVRMDFGGSGVVETRDITLDDGVVFASNPLALAFDWRGRLADLAFTETKVSITLQYGTSADDQRRVDVTRSGDVTIDSDVYLDEIVNINADDLTPRSGIDSGSTINANNTATPTPSPTTYPTPSPSPTATATPTPSPSPTVIPTPTPSPSPTATPSPTPSPSPTATPLPSPTQCLVSFSTSPSPLSIGKNGGGSGTISFTITGSSGTVTPSGNNPSNLQVTRSSGNNFTVTSLNNSRGDFTLVFSTPCGTSSVGVSITN